MKTLLLFHTAATLFMFGVIVVVQVVHYPLFARVGAEGYAAYQHAHMRRITGVVLPPMLVELGTAACLALHRPPGLPAWMPGAGLALVAVIWISTGLLQVPLHGRLAGGFDAALHRRLVRTNGVRTAAWGLRAALALAMLAPFLRPPTPSLP